MSIEAINPATGALIQHYEAYGQQQVEQILSESFEAYDAWRTTSFSHRADRLREAAHLLRQRRDALAEIMALEMGKPVAQGVGEAEKCAWVCEYYAEYGESFLTPQVMESDATRSFVAFRPIGPVLAVMPWNFPFWQVFRFAAPALMAGNTGLLKHASNVPGCALAIESLLHEAGFPSGVFRTLLIGASQVADVIASPHVRGVTLTGSTPAGRAVAARAGEHLKKSVLELGGSDPYVILEDADLDQAVETCVNSRLINSGQSCISAKRFIVVESMYEQFATRYVELMKEKKAGPPMEEGIALGPLARTDLRDDLHRQVEESIQRGAKLLLGGTVPPGEGAWYPPTVLADVKKGMPAYDDELFGPVAAIIRVKDEAEAIRVANDTVFGLGAAVFTRDTARGQRIAEEQFEAGACFVNSLVKSDPRLPFGGIKESGYGRELSVFGIREFTNIKTVYVA